MVPEASGIEPSHIHLGDWIQRQTLETLDHAHAAFYGTKSTPSTASEPLRAQRAVIRTSKNNWTARGRPVDGPWTSKVRPPSFGGRPLPDVDGRPPDVQSENFRVHHVSIESPPAIPRTLKMILGLNC